MPMSICVILITAPKLNTSPCRKCCPSMLLIPILRALVAVFLTADYSQQFS